MKQIASRVVIVLVALGLASLGAVGFSGSANLPKPPAALLRASDPGLKAIRSYKQWTRVNLTSLPLSPLNAGLCRMVMPGERIASQENPHRGKFFAVYVNEVGGHAMMSQLQPVFPQDSVIIKEKPSSEESTAPELLTVMIKREKGFNPDLGDWEFLVVNGAVTEIQGRGKLAHCQSCHLMKTDTDYVFRTYLSNEARHELQ